WGQWLAASLFYPRHERSIGTSLPFIFSSVVCPSPPSVHLPSVDGGSTYPVRPSPHPTAVCIRWSKTHRPLFCGSGTCSTGRLPKVGGLVPKRDFVPAICD